MFPSRSPALEKRAIESLWEHATTDQWTCLVGLDPGDHRQDTAQVRHFTLPPALYFRDRHNDDHELFRPTWAINWLARQTDRASHFWALNDDVVVNTIAWDTKILTVAPAELGLTDYTPAAGWHSNFPAFTRAHLEEFGTLFHKAFWGWGADHWICRTYALAGRARWLRIDLEHAQAELTRQQRIQAHQPPPPPQAEQIEWAQRIQLLAQKKGAGTKPTPAR